MSTTYDLTLDLLQRRSVTPDDAGCQALIAAHPRHQGSVALLLTADEEDPAVDGTIRVVELLLDTARDP